MPVLGQRFGNGRGRKLHSLCPRYGGCAFHVTVFGTLSPLAVPLSMTPAVRLHRVYRRSSGTETMLVEGGQHMDGEREWRAGRYGCSRLATG